MALSLATETRFIISFVLSPSKSSIPAYKLFKNASSLTRASPAVIITDNWNSYNQATALNYPNSVQHKYSSLNNLTPTMVAGANYSAKNIKN